MVYVKKGTVQIVNARQGCFKEEYLPFTKCSFETDCQYSDVGTIPDIDKMLATIDCNKVIGLSGKFRQVSINTCVDRCCALSCVVESTGPYISLLKGERVYSIPSPKIRFSGFQIFFSK